MKVVTRNRIGYCTGAFVVGMVSILPEYVIPLKIVGFAIIGFFVWMNEAALEEQGYQKGFEDWKASGKKIGYGLSKVIKKELSK